LNSGICKDELFFCSLLITEKGPVITFVSTAVKKYLGDYRKSIPGHPFRCPSLYGANRGS